MRNLFKYSRFYSGREPEFIEGDIFKIIVPLDENLMVDCTTQSTTQSTTQTATQLMIQAMADSPEKEILQLIDGKPSISQKEISEKLSTNLNTIKYRIRKMQESGILGREGSSRKGKWIIKVNVR